MSAFIPPEQAPMPWRQSWSMVGSTVIGVVAGGVVAVLWRDQPGVATPPVVMAPQVVEVRYIDTATAVPTATPTPRPPAVATRTPMNLCDPALATPGARCRIAASTPTPSVQVVYPAGEPGDVVMYPTWTAVPTRWQP